MKTVSYQLSVFILFVLFAALSFNACSDMNSTIDEDEVDLVNSEVPDVQNAAPKWVTQKAGVSKSATVSAISNTYCGASFETTLLAGKNINAGTLTVKNDNQELLITYTTTDDWALQKTSLDVAADLSAFPVNRAGAPKIGLFKNKKSHDVNTYEYTYTLQLEDLGLEPGQQAFIAAHADIVHPEHGSEGAWGEGERFTQRGTWAMYFIYTVNACNKDFVLFTTDKFLGANSSTWLTDREHANQVCGNYAESQGIAGDDFRIVYSTQQEDARDYLEYDASRGDRVFDRDNNQVGGEDIWAGDPVILADLKSYTITATGLDGRFKIPPLGSYEFGSWPICQNCNKMYACASSTDSPFNPSASCWTGTRAIVCMGEK